MKRQRGDGGMQALDFSLQSIKKSHATSPKAWLCQTVDSRRARCLTPAITQPNTEGESVMCLLQRDLRLQDNWALLFAQDAALSLKTPLHVVHLVVPKHTYQPTLRHLSFHLKGLEELAEDLSNHGIGFHCIPVIATEDDASIEEARDSVKTVLAKLKPSLVVCDFMPLRRPDELAKHVAEECLAVGCPLYQVDAHNIVPVWFASSKQEYAARTFRPRVMGFLNEFANEFPPIQQHPHKCRVDEGDTFKASNIMDKLKFDDRVCLPQGWVPGAKAGLAALQKFCMQPRLAAYAARNDPLEIGQSSLSPWIHFGQLSAQRCLLSVKKLGPASKLGATAAAARESFIEELVVRRELAENFTFYNAHYDQIGGAAKWAQETLDAHRDDKREHIYSLSQFEESRTHDALWNASQLQLVREGKMHGFLRMYWAKKILEWTCSPESGLQISLYLNDKYSLDGTEPSGVVGCMWSIAGVHDQGWAERPIFGKIRFMNLAGCKRKLRVDEFIKRFPGAATAAAKEKTKGGRVDY